MCSQCPFRINAPAGWLGDYTAEDIIKIIQMEEPFYCHKQVEEHSPDGYDDPEWQEWAEENADQCVGSLIMAKRMCKLPRDRKHSEAVKAVDATQPILFPPQVFVAHHTARKKPRSDRQKPAK